MSLSCSLVRYLLNNVTAVRQTVSVQSQAACPSRREHQHERAGRHGCAAGFCKRFRRLYSQEKALAQEAASAGARAHLRPLHRTLCGLVTRGLNKSHAKHASISFRVYPSVVTRRVSEGRSVVTRRVSEGRSTGNAALAVLFPRAAKISAVSKR